MSEQGEALNVGRKSRTIPPAIRRALRRRDKGCRYPGCTHTRFVDAHHVQHWAHGGETKLDNLVLLCRRHHTLIHDNRASIEVVRPNQGSTQFHFYDQHGERILPNGDTCLATANVTTLEPEPVADVSAVTSEAQAPLAPVNPSNRPDYGAIAEFLQEIETPCTTGAPPDD